MLVPASGPSPSRYHVPFEALVSMLMSLGVPTAEDASPAVFALLQTLRASVATPGYVSVRDLLLVLKPRNIIVRALTGSLAIGDFNLFRNVLTGIFEASKVNTRYQRSNARLTAFRTVNMAGCFVTWNDRALRHQLICV
jgi:hypothetical protein